MEAEMPLYEYCCETHGAFDEFRPHKSANLPAPCPICGAEAPRALTPPRTRVMDSARRIGMERNEKSCHAPRKHVCHAGCNHGPGVTQEQPLRAYTGSRPWVVEHA